MGTLSNVNTFLRTTVLIGIVCIGGWWTVFFKDKFSDKDAALRETRQEIEVLQASVKHGEEQIDTMTVELEVAEEEIFALETARKLLTVDHRVAKIDVVEQVTDAEGNTTTRVRFTEFDAEGEPFFEPIETDIEGTMLYVETLVIKFNDTYVEEGDALRGSSVCIFKRLFGEKQRPADGTPLDPAGQLPPVYASDDIPVARIEPLWERFWDYANDADLAAEKGVRAIHGEAPFIELRAGKSYDVELRASGGVSIRPSN